MWLPESSEYPPFAILEVIYVDLPILRAVFQHEAKSLPFGLIAMPLVDLWDFRHNFPPEAFAPSLQ